MRRDGKITVLIEHFQPAEYLRQALDSGSTETRSWCVLTPGLGAFGLDPMQNKGMEGVDEFQTERVAIAPQHFPRLG